MRLAAGAGEAVGAEEGGRTVFVVSGATGLGGIEGAFGAVTTSIVEGDSRSMSCLPAVLPTPARHLGQPPQKRIAGLESQPCCQLTDQRRSLMMRWRAL